jgi:RNA polymerase sigma factor (sigma-70 family)
LRSRRRDENPRSFEASFPLLVGFAFNVGWRYFRGDRALAEDVAQETMTRAFVAWGRLAEHPNREAWVTTTALHVAMEFSRRDHRAHRVPADAPTEASGLEDRVVTADQLRQAMTKLSARQQQVVVWRYYFDCSVTETAARLGLTESKVKDASHEATTKLGRLLPRAEVNGT